MNRNHPDYGKGTHHVDAELVNSAMIGGDVLIRRTVERFRQPDYTPPKLPKAAHRLMVLTQQSKVRLSQIVEALERDELLTSNVLKTARSPLYMSGNGIRSIRDALVRLGLNQVRNIVLQESMRMRIFRSREYTEPMATLNKHHVATANLSRLIAQTVGGIAPETAFMAGLLHDIGITVILLALGDLPRGETAPKLAGVTATIHEVHTEASERILELWDMPDEVRMVACFHHHPWLAPEPMQKLVSAVCVAEELATQLGYPALTSELYCNLDRTPTAMLEQPLCTLGLAHDDDTFQLLKEEGRKLVDLI
ncbi:MAG: HDOD domain-containing protein [Myxococcota bacterium]